PPKVRLRAERALARTVESCATERLLTSAHDVSDGGLAQTLVEACLTGGVGARVDLDSDPFVALFSESAARAVVTCRDTDLDRVLELATEAGVAVGRIGR